MIMEKIIDITYFNLVTPVMLQLLYNILFSTLYVNIYTLYEKALLSSSIALFSYYLLLLLPFSPIFFFFFSLITYNDHTFIYSPILRPKKNTTINLSNYKKKFIRLFVIGQLYYTFMETSSFEFYKLFSSQLHTQPGC